MATRALPILVRAKDPEPLKLLRRRALNTETLRPSIPEVPRPRTLRPVTEVCTPASRAALTLPHLKTKLPAGFPLPPPVQPTRGSQSPRPRARGDFTAGCLPRTWGWEERSPATCHSTQPLPPVSQVTRPWPARASIPSAAWRRCPSSWRGPGPGQPPRPAPLRTLSVPARTAASAPWATSSPA